MKAAVAYINFFDNEIILEVVEIEEKDWRLALHAHSAFNKYPLEDIDWLPSDYEDARSEAANGEMDFQIEWIEPCQN